ncbi:hypothetical protein [Nocardia sp. XZ_19_231]|uniref:hypothetical protein n=1 Tax=Nocardia sp. XZ_19_231 TaxID=2769252 RepID=UPI00188ED8FB|nr:hypothetical protein [Nocardia sp. XZ_19_231]
MDKGLELKLQRWSAWSGFLLLAAFIVAFTMGKLMPPWDPNLGADGVVEMLVDNRTAILLAVVIMVLAVPFEYPFVVVTSLQLRRIEGGWGIISMIQLLTGVVAPIGFFFPLAIMAAAAYRPEAHSPDVLLALTDVFWLMLVGNACIFVLQVWSIGFGALIDKRAKPVFPRWFAYLNFLLGFLLIPGAFVFLFKTGPLAWNGLFAFWIPSMVYFVWKIATPWLLLKAVESEAEEVAAASPAAS